MIDHSRLCSRLCIFVQQLYYGLTRKRILRSFPFTLKEAFGNNGRDSYVTS